MKNAEQFADEILQSAQHIERAKAPDFLLENILNKIDKEEVNKIIPLKKLKWLSIAASLLIAGNLLVLSLENNTENPVEQSNNAESLPRWRVQQHRSFAENRR